MWCSLLWQVWSEVHSLTIDVCKIIARLIKIVSLCVFRAQGYRKWHHYWTPEKDYGSFLGEMSGAVHNVRFDANRCIWLYPFPHRSPRKRLLYPTSSPQSSSESSSLVGDKQPVREVSPQSSSESDQEEPVGMNQTPPTGAYRTRSVGATISTAAQHASPKLILPSSCANDYHQSGLTSLIRNILNPKGRSFVLSYNHWHECSL